MLSSTVVHTGTTIWSVFMALSVTGGIAVIAMVAGLCAWLIARESSGRPIIPWGARMRVERSKAHTEIMAEQLKQDATEIKRLAIGAQRDVVLEAIREGDMPKVQALGLPSGGNGKIEDASWTPR